MTTTATQQRAMGVLVAAAFGVLAWIAWPIATGLILGALVAFTLYPAYRRTARATHRPVLAAVAWTAGATALVAGTIFLFVNLLVTRGHEVAAAAPGLLDRALRVASRFGLRTDAVVRRARDAAGDLAPRVAEYAGVLTEMVFRACVALLFAAMTTFVVLRRWAPLVRCLEAISPLPRSYTRQLLEQLRVTGHRVMLGTVITGFVQGALAALGYRLFGVPQPAFFGALTAVASLLPLFGTMFVWVPIGVYLVATGRPGQGTLELLWGALVVVALCDYLVRAKLVGGGESMKLFPTLIAFFGGISLFGFFGLILGPILCAFALDTIALYRRERAARGLP